MPPYKEMPQFKAIPDKMFEIPQPGIGGLNLNDLEFEQEPNQSPYMLNMMYRNGTFSKRFGQDLLKDADGDLAFGDTVHSIVYFDERIFVHAGSKIYTYTYGSDPTELGVTLPNNKGQFIVYSQKLYYLVKHENPTSLSDFSGFYEYNGTNFVLITTYIPETYINCRPNTSADLQHYEVFEEPNLLCTQVTHLYNADSSVSVYQVYDEDGINYTITPTIKVDDVAETNFTYSQQNKTITFASGHIPASGDMNVAVTWTLKDTVNATERSEIYSSKFHDTFGGSNNSCLIVAGCGGSKYYYSNAYDIAYFPVSNYGTIGNTEDDITGFGRQYNVLIMFKPRETYSLYSYVLDASNSNIEEKYGSEAFKTQLVNARIGCDCPYSIQLVNNLLTWFNTKEGVCTLVSTNIQDERNIRVISRNIQKLNNFGVRGVLDYGENPSTIQSADYDSKYFLVFPASGICFMWDYEISPYTYTSRGETPPEKLDWYIFDHFYVKEFLRVGKDLIYSSNYKRMDGDDVISDFTKTLVKIDETFHDLDFNGDGEADGIRAYYMTPFLQFGSVEMLKNVRNLFVQGRGDFASIIDIYYYTDDSAEPEHEPESIDIGGKGKMWDNFKWDDFAWFMNTWGHTYRRKCNLKKVQMCAFYFENDKPNKDMNLTNIGIQYQLVKYIR